MKGKPLLDDHMWTAIDGFLGYEAHPGGYIKSLGYYAKRGRNGVAIIPPKIVNPVNNGKGYFIFGFGKARTPEYVHRVIAKTFIPNPLLLPEVNHKDLNKANNCVSNLEWVTRLENAQHMRKNKLDFKHHDVRGVKNPKNKLSEEDIIRIKILKGSMTVVDIAKEYGITIYHVYNIFKGNNWKHLNVTT